MHGGDLPNRAVGELQLGLPFAACHGVRGTAARGSYNYCAVRTAVLCATGEDPRTRSTALGGALTRAAPRSRTPDPHSGAHGKGPEGAAAVHRSLSARVPRGTSTSHPNPSPRWGNRTVGLVWVGDNDEAALVSPWAAREGKLALGLTGRHRSRLEARGGDLAAAKNGACGRAPIGRPEIWDKQTAIIKAWLASGRPPAIPRFRRSQGTCPADGTTKEKEGEGTRVRVGSHEALFARSPGQNALGRTTLH